MRVRRSNTSKVAHTHEAHRRVGGGAVAEVGRLAHGVVLTDLRKALEHLNRLAFIGYLEGVGRDDAAAAERARGEPFRARLERGDRVRPTLLVRNLLLWGQCHVEGELRCDNEHVWRDCGGKSRTHVGVVVASTVEKNAVNSNAKKDSPP
mgnify:CR=1 FL=1